MKKLFLLLFLTTASYGQIVRWDFLASTTGNPVSGASAPAGSLVPILGISNAGVKLCTDAACTIPVTTYTDSTGTTQCTTPTGAQLTRPGGAAGCFATADAQGNLGAWLQATTTPLYYKITAVWGSFIAPFSPPGSGGGGGAGNPSLPFTSIQFNNGGTFGGTTVAVTDTLGNIRVPSINGTPDAFLNQTTPTSNNGIHNSLQVTGNAVTANLDYPLSSFNELQSYSNNCRFPMFWTGFPIVPLCGIADQTTLFDYRAFSRGRLDHNPNAISQAGPMEYIKLIRDNNIDGYQTFEDYVNGQQIFCCNPPSNGFGQTFMTGWEFNLQDNTNEITSTLTVQANKQGQSDFQLLQLIQHVNGQFNTPSDEGGANMRRISVTDNLPFFGSLNSTVAPGNNVFPITPDSNSIYAGEMKLMTDRTQARPPWTVTAVSGGGYPSPPEITITQTVTPDIRCVVNSTVSVNGKIHAGTTATTFAVTGCTGAIVTTSPMLIAGSQNIQTVKVTSGGTTSITANLFSGINVGDVIYQGPNAGGAINVVANTHGAYNDITEIIGCPSAHVCDYVSLGVGAWQGGLNGAFTLTHLANGVTMTRSGGTVSVPVTFADTTGLFFGACFIVATAVDTTFNGTHCVLTDDGASPVSTITWADSGANATTTTTGFSYLKAGNGQPANQVIYYPAVRILQASNPSTFENDGTMVTMEHSWTGNPGDELYSGPSDQLPFTMDHSTWQNEVPTSPQLAVATYAEAQVINPGPQDSFIHVFASTNNGNSDFIGPGGGTQIPSYELFHVDGQAVYHIYNDFAYAPDNQGYLTIVRGCGLYPCTSPFSTFTVLSLPGPSGPGGFAQTWAPSTTTMEYITGGNVFEFAPTFSFFGQPVNVQAEVSVNSNGSGLGLFSAVATNGSALEGAFEAGATGAHTHAWGTFGNGQSSGLTGVNGVYDETTNIFVWSSCTAGGIFFGTPISGGNVCAGTGAVASISASGVIVGTSVGPSASSQWTTGAGAPSGACTTGSLYTSTTGTTTNNLWVCGSTAWQLVH